MLRARRASSVVELLVAVLLLGIIGGLVTGTLMQQGRVRTRIVRRLVAEAQLREAVAPVLADLGAASPAAGDVIPALATDTSLALRIATAEGVACDRDASDSMSVRTLLLSSMRGRSIATGDSAWLYQDGRWIAAPVQQVSGDAATDACYPSGSDGGSVVRVTLGGVTPPRTGAAMRFTRRVRYSFYRAGDGETYLGLREWSTALGAFAGQQPVAGPLSRAGTAFRFLDSLGNPMNPSGASAGMLAQVALDLSGSRMSGEAATSVPALRASVALRNRR